MRLSEVNVGEVLKDIEFDWLGLTSEEYEGKKVLTFLNDIKYFNEIENNKTIVGIITTREIANKLQKEYGLLVVENPKKVFFELHNKLVDKKFYFKNKKNEISDKAFISPKAILGKSNIIIEDNVIVEAGVIVYPNVTIKAGAVIKGGTVLGADGFQYLKFKEKIIKVDSIGEVIIEENVVIQNNCVIDKGVFDKTVIGKNSKIYNLVHIAHDSKIGENIFITAGVIICGRVKVGKNSYLGPNCTIKNGLSLGENSKVSMGAVVTKNVGDNEIVTGNFAIQHFKYLKYLKYILEKLEKMGGGGVTSYLLRKRNTLFFRVGTLQNNGII